jgi:hypothetical protein
VRGTVDNQIRADFADGLVDMPLAGDIQFLAAKGGDLMDPAEYS